MMPGSGAGRLTQALRILLFRLLSALVNRTSQLEHHLVKRHLLIKALRYACNRLLGHQVLTAEVLSELVKALHSLTLEYLGDFICVK